MIADERFSGMIVIDLQLEIRKVVLYVLDQIFLNAEEVHGFSIIRTIIIFILIAFFVMIIVVVIFCFWSYGNITNGLE